MDMIARVFRDAPTQSGHCLTCTTSRHFVRHCVDTGASARLNVFCLSQQMVPARAASFGRCFIDAIPAIIIVGTILAPLAAKVDMYPIYFVVIGAIFIAHGLVTPPNGLCLMIACSRSRMR